MGGPSSDSSSSEAEGEPWSAQEDCVLPHPLLRRVRSNSCTPIIGRVSTQPSTPEPHAMESRMKQLRGSREKLKCFNRLLLAVLQGHKGRCEGLSMQLGQREAEATALCLALQYSEDCEEAYGVLLALTAACCSAPGEEAVVAGARATEVASRLLAEKEAALDGGTPQPSSEGSSVDQPTPWELAARLRSYIQRLRDRRALVQVPSELGPAAEPGSTVPHTEAMVHAILETQPGPTLPRLEKFQIQQELAATREAMTDLMLWLQLLRREKRGLELREAALRAQGPVHALLLQQLRRERAHLGGDSSGGDSSGGDSSGDEALRARGPLTPFGGQTDRVWDSESLPQELAATLDRTLVLRGQLRTLRRELEQAAEKGRAQRAQNAQLTTELCKAHSALALALRGAHRQQEERRSRLEARAARLQARQAEELRVLEATARALGTPGPPRPAAPLGETVL